MALRLWLAPLARIDLEQIARASVEAFGPTRARAYGDLIELALARLQAEPQLPESRLRLELGDGRRSLRLSTLARRSRSGRHVIFYRPGPDEVIVQRILHERMDPSFAAGLIGDCDDVVEQPTS